MTVEHTERPETNRLTDAVTEFSGRARTTQLQTSMKQREDAVVGSIRIALTHVDTDHALVRMNMRDAHILFGDHLSEWSHDFGTLYNQMLDLYRAHTPKEKGHYRVSHRRVGYSSFPVTIWVADKVQPPIPTAHELVARFDQVISAYQEKEKYNEYGTYGDR